MGSPIRSFRLHLALFNQSNQVSFVPARLASGKPYTVLLLKRGENYGSADFYPHRTV